MLYILVEAGTIMNGGQLIGLLNIKTSNGNSLVALSALENGIVRSKEEHLFILSAEIRSKLLEFVFLLNGIQHVLFRSMEIWDVQDSTNLNYQAELLEYPDYLGSTESGELILINGDQCT